MMDMHGPGGLGLSSAAAAAANANARLIECCCEDNDFFPPLSGNKKEKKIKKGNNKQTRVTIMISSFKVLISPYPNVLKIISHEGKID